MVGETNRAPFDLPEAEGELVGGFHTEYSSMRFAMFFMAEYMNMITVSALAVTLFLGGWHAPLPFNLIPGADAGYWGLLWFVVKVLVMLFIFVWLRGTLPRLRYDQFMRFGWRWLIPDLARLDRYDRGLAARPAGGLVQRDRTSGWPRPRSLSSLSASTFFGGKEQPEKADEAALANGWANSMPLPAAIRCRRWVTRCCRSLPRSSAASRMPRRTDRPVNSRPRKGVRPDGVL